MKIFLPLSLAIALSGSPAFADCNIADAKLEEAISSKPEFRNPHNRQLVRDSEKIA